MEKIYVVCVYKAKLVSNYQPVFLVSKLLEHIVVIELMHYLRLLSDVKFGFRPGSSLQDSPIFQ